METVIAAIISAVVTLVVCVVNSRSEQAKTRALIEYKLDELQKKVEKHNGVIERTFVLEGQMRECMHDIKSLKAFHIPN